MKTIIGAGGGGKSGGESARVAKESRDTLQSLASAKIIDLVSEGEIVGLVDGFKSIYLDGTPLQNSDGSYNFSGFTIETRVGTQDQDYIPRFPASENETAVGVEVKKSISVVRTITNNAIDAVRVRISIPQLTKQNKSNGDITGYAVKYRIDLQSNGGGYQTKIENTVSGKSTSKYEISHRVELAGEGPWDIRVVRVSEDDPELAFQSRTFWESYTEVIDGKLRYPNSALMGIEIDSSQFSSIPTRGYDIKGLKIRVPSNYDPETRTYAGSWDGTFQVAYSNNPAWCFYDMLTAERYALGNFIPEDQVDKWSLYEIGRYCDELVPDGFGGTEPRFTCNLYLQTREEAFKVIQDMASIFRAMLFWANGSITTVQDAPADPVYLFSSSNVVDGVFSYSGSSAKSRHTVAQVTWNDPADLYSQKVEYVEDDEGIARFGVIETQVTAFGCTSRGQANRLGRWLLYSEQHQTEVVTFKSGLDGSQCRPGQVIKVSDPARAGERRSGRLLFSTSTQLQLDQVVTINPSQHRVSILMPDGSVEERGVQSAIGSMIVPDEAFSTTPAPGAIWMLQSTEIEPQLFKIIGIIEGEDGTHEITALEHREDKYDFIENGLELEPRSISGLSTVPASPVGIKFTETLYEANGEVRVKVTVSWQAVRGASSYLVSYKRDEGNVIYLPATPTNEIEILDAEPGVYTATVVAVNPLGVKSVPSTGTAEIIGKALPPADVEGFSLLPNAGTAYLSWNKSPDLDVLSGGYVRIRHTPEIVDPVWRNSVDIGPALAGSSTRTQLPLIPGTYLAKFVDSSGNASNAAALITTTVPEALALNVVETIAEHPSFDGVKTDMEYYADLEGLVLSAATLFDDVEDVDAIESFDFAGGVAPMGTYDFADVIDLTEVYTSRITAIIRAEAVDVADTFDLRLDPMDTWADLDGDFIDDVNAELFLQTTLDDPNDPDAVWTEWKRFFVGEYSARGLRFQLRATTETSDHNIVVKELSVTIDMPDRVVSMAGLTSGAGVYSVEFAEPFKETPAVGITASNLNSGDYWEITNKTRAGFDIAFKNASSLAVSRVFDVVAKGYGRQLN